MAPEPGACDLGAAAVSVTITSVLFPAGHLLRRPRGSDGRGGRHTAYLCDAGDARRRKQRESHL
jgi:hypothetical protein